MDNRVTVDRAALFSPLPLVAVKARIGGETDMRTVAGAIRSALSANRVFCSRVEIDETGAAALVPAEKITCKVAVMTKSFDQIAAEQSSIPFDIENGEFVRFFLRQLSGGVEITIAAHKLVCDAGSLMILVEDIAAALSGRTLERREARLADEDDIPEDTSMVAKLAIKQINKQWVKNKAGLARAFTFEDRERITAHYWKDRAPQLIRGELPEELRTAADRTAAAYGVNRMAVIMMAVVNALGDMANISYNVDTRFSGDRTIRNLTFGASVVHGYDERRDVCANIQYMQEIIDDAENDTAKQSVMPGAIALLEPTLVDSIFLTALEGFSDPSSVKVTRTLGYDGDTHNVALSVIDADKYAHFASGISLCPPSELNTYLAVAIVNERGRIEMSVNCPDKKAVNRAMKFFDNFTVALEKLTSAEEDTQ